MPDINSQTFYASVARALRSDSALDSLANAAHLLLNAVYNLYP